MLVVLALDGDALLLDNTQDQSAQQGSAQLACHIQRECIRRAAEAIAEIAQEHQVVLLHSYSPRRGMLSLMNHSWEDDNTFPVDTLSAFSIGMIGFLLEQDLRNALLDRQLCTISLHTLVDEDDPAFANPDQEVGPSYSFAEAQMLATTNPEWVLRKIGEHYRRVLPSPAPCEILELRSFRQLTCSGDIFISCGDGGGIPLRKGRDGIFHGVSGIIDPLQTASLLAESLEADGLVYLTRHECIKVVSESGKIESVFKAAPDKIQHSAVVDSAIVNTLEYVCHFVRSGGKFGVIGAVNRTNDILAETSGTFIKVRVPEGISYYE